MMEPAGGGGGGGAPAPFLLKTYEMVDDSSTDEIVSWSSNKNSFIVWNPPEFSRLLLPTYFKHNNFSSFIRQLNTYGFRKIDSERWEFANEEFMKDKKHLLKNIHRRKPIHSHTHPQGSEDSERAALDEEIEKLTREKTSIQANLWRVKQHKSRTKLQLEELEHKVQEMEQRQLNMMTYLAKAVNNPAFVEQLVRMGSSSMFFSAINKKRRVPKVDSIQDVAATSCIDDHNSTSKSVSSNPIPHDFCNMLRLELSPAVSDTNFFSPTVQSSNEEGLSPQTRTSDEDPNDVSMRTEALMLVPETLELSDTGTSFSMKKNSLLRRGDTDLTSIDDGDGHIPCHLSLTLASCSLQVDNSHSSTKALQSNRDNASSAAGKEGNTRDHGNDINMKDNDVAISSSREGLTSNHGNSAPQGRVNDVFWEQFLTERPGSSDTEEASSNYRANQLDEQEEGRHGHEKSWKDGNNMEQLTL